MSIKFLEIDIIFIEADMFPLLFPNSINFEYLGLYLLLEILLLLFAIFTVCVLQHVKEIF